MAITTLSGVEAGLKPPFYFSKAPSGTKGAGIFRSQFYATGSPEAAATPSPGIAGDALTSYAGQIPFANPASGNAYLARLDGPTATRTGGLVGALICDRLWHNSGIDGTSTSAQTVNSVTFPARDANGSTDGEGIVVAMEFVNSTSSAAGMVASLSYTNSAGASGRTASTPALLSGGNSIGDFYFFNLDAGDTGVRSIQSVTLSTSLGVAAPIALVACRVIAMAAQAFANEPYSQQDAIAAGFPRLYDNTVPFVVHVADSAASGSTGGNMTLQYAHG